MVAKDPEKNIVFASNQYDEEIFAQARSEFHVENIQWISGHKPDTGSDENSRKFQLDMKCLMAQKYLVSLL